MRLRFTVRQLRQHAEDLKSELAIAKLMLKASGHEQCAPLSECELYLQRLAAYREQATTSGLDPMPWVKKKGPIPQEAMARTAPAKDGQWSKGRVDVVRPAQPEPTAQQPEPAE